MRRLLTWPEFLKRWQSRTLGLDECQGDLRAQIRAECEAMDRMLERFAIKPIATGCDNNGEA